GVSVGTRHRAGRWDHERQDLRVTLAATGGLRIACRTAGGGRDAQPQPGPRGPALAADREACTRIRTPGTARGGPAGVIPRAARRALPAQRLGQLVSGVPYRAPGTHALCR